MKPIRSVAERLTDDSFRAATLVALASIPFTIALSWGSPDGVVYLTGGTISGEPLLLAGLVVGYLYSSRATKSRRAGVHAGLVGSIGTIVVYIANALDTMLAQSAELSIIAAALTPIVLLIGVGLSVLVVVVGAVAGEWLTEKFTGIRVTSVGS